MKFSIIDDNDIPNLIADRVTADDGQAPFICRYIYKILEEFF